MINRLADDDAGAVVDEKTLADRRAGVDVDARARVRQFGDAARDDHRAQVEQLVREAVVERRDRAG